MTGGTVAVTMAAFTVFGVGGFGLGWFAGKRAYKDKVPAYGADDL